MNPTRPTHFFKIILKEAPENNKLQFPAKFVRKYGNGLSNRILVKLPCGSEWRLGLSKSDGKMWIDKDWVEFSKHYSLAYGHFLVFRYEGNSKFDVVIIDRTTTEIEDYPSRPGQNDDIGNGKEEEEEEEKDDADSDDNSIEILEDFSPPPHRSTEVQSRSPAHKRMRSSRFRRNAGERRLSAEEIGQALERAKGFKSEHPFFMCVMQPSAVEINFVLSVPITYAKDRIGISCKNAILVDPQGKEWSVKLCTKNHNANLVRAIMRRGWKAFAFGNNLRRGDLCVFVQIDKSLETVTFEISIYRANGTVNSAHLPSSSERPRSRPLQRRVQGR